MPSSQTWLICHTNPYALVLFVTVSYLIMMCYMVLNISQAADLPFSWIIVNTSIPSLGVVACVYSLFTCTVGTECCFFPHSNITLPPIVFARYLSLSSSTPVVGEQCRCTGLCFSHIYRCSSCCVESTYDWSRHCCCITCEHSSVSTTLSGQSSIPSSIMR